MGDSGHGDFLGNVLSYQTVKILVGAAFPRMVGCSEVALQGEVLLELYVAMEFSAVVKGDRLEAGFVFADCIQGGLSCRGGGARFQLFDDGETGFPFNESKNAVMAVAADHSISLPMTELRTGFDHRRSLRNMALSWKNSA